MHLHGRNYGWLLVAIGLAIAAPAAAQDATFTVITNDGSTYQGQLVENVVGQHVTIKLASGELRTFQASDVRATSATMNAPVLPNIVVSGVPIPGTAGGPPVAYEGSDAVRIHVEKADASEGRLFMETASGWAPVCTMPCSTSVDPKIDYKLYNSDPFRFPQNRGVLDLTVDNSARRGFRTAGAVMAPVGGVGIVFGILYAANVFSSLGTPNTPAEQQAVSSAQSANLAGGLVILGASVAVMTIGFVFLALHPSPTMTTRAGDRIVKRDGIKITPAGVVF